MEQDIIPWEPQLLESGSVFICGCDPFAEGEFSVVTTLQLHPDGRVEYLDMRSPPAK